MLSAANTRLAEPLPARLVAADDLNRIAERSALAGMIHPSAAMSRAMTPA